MTPLDVQVSGAKQRASLKQQLSNVQRKLAVAVESNRASAGKLQRLDKFRRELDGNTAALQITNNSLQAISSSLQANLTARTADEVHLDAEVKTLKAISAVLQVWQFGKNRVLAGV